MSSVQHDNNHPDILSKIKFLHQERAKRDKRLQQQRKQGQKQREIKQMQSCTFVPQFISDSGAFTVTQGRFLEREDVWFKSKEKKLQEARQRKTKEQKAKYPFHPQKITHLHKQKPQNSPLKSETRLKTDKPNSKEQMSGKKTMDSLYSSTTRSEAAKSKQSYRQLHDKKMEIHNQIKNQSKPFDLATSQSDRLLTRKLHHTHYQTSFDNRTPKLGKMQTLAPKNSLVQESEEIVILDSPKSNGQYDREVFMREADNIVEIKEVHQSDDENENEEKLQDKHCEESSKDGKQGWNKISKEEKTGGGFINPETRDLQQCDGQSELE